MITLIYFKKDFRMMLNVLKMNLRDRYLGSIIGIYWAVINPILLLGVYTFVFGFVIQSRIPGSEKSITYVIWLISGLAPWFGINGGIIHGCNALTNNSAMVKNIVFKIEVLPFSSSLLGAVPMLVSTFFLIILIIVSGAPLDFHVFWLLPIFILQFLFIIGISYFTAAINVFIRDLNQLVGTALLISLFFTPIFYPVDLMPAIIKKLTFFNPFFQIVDSYRCAVVYKSNPDLYGILYLIIITSMLWFFGLKFFKKLKGHFESLL